MIVFDIVGYVGMVALLIAVFTIRKEKHVLLSDLSMIIGNIGIGVNSAWYNAYPAAIVNVILFVISIGNLRKDLRKKK